MLPAILVILVTKVSKDPETSLSEKKEKRVPAVILVCLDCLVLEDHRAIMATPESPAEASLVLWVPLVPRVITATLALSVILEGLAALA